MHIVNRREPREIFRRRLVCLRRTSIFQWRTSARSGEVMCQICARRSVQRRVEATAGEMERSAFSRFHRGGCSQTVRRGSTNTKDYIQRRRLRQVLRTTPNAKLYRRLLAIVEMDKGTPVTQIAGYDVWL